MISKIKKTLYFPIANYFRFFAKIQLSLWKPRIIVVTGSSGKTTLLHLIESQIGDRAKYSHLANSSFGIPFDILGLKRKSLMINEWIFLFFLTPFKAFKRPFKEKIYVVEADCDRPNEGKFLSELLKPEVTLWISSNTTHSVNFDILVNNKKFESVEKAIAYEFGYFIQRTTKLSIVNGDSRLIDEQLKRTKSLCKKVTKDYHLDDYKLSKNHTIFKIDGKIYSFNFLLPEDAFYSIYMCNSLLQYLQMQSDPSFSNFILPEGRSSLFKGIKNTILIDSTYNATPDGMRAIIEMYSKYPSEKKWLVLGDMIELGLEEEKEHKKLAEIISKIKLEKIILVGPRLSKYTSPMLKTAKSFIMPKEALDYLNENIKNEETILFKGARFLEGILENLLLNKNDANFLVRREKIWQIRRRKWNL